MKFTLYLCGNIPQTALTMVIRPLLAYFQGKGVHSLYRRLLFYHWIIRVTKNIFPFIQGNKNKNK